MENAQNLKNLLDFFIACGVDESIEDEPINHYERGNSTPVITIKTAENVQSVVKNTSLSDKTEKLLEGINDLDALKTTLDNFDCDIKKYCMNILFGRGVSTPSVMVIGEMPSADGDKSGIAYSDASGELLDKMLGAVGLSVNTNTYLSYIFPYKTPGNRMPTFDELSMMTPFVKKQIEILKPKLIICLNIMPLNVLTGLNWSIAKNHGEFTKYGDIDIVAIHDPELLLLDVSKKKIVWDDLQQIKKVAL